MKIVTDGVVHHLFLMDQVSNESKTLCGSTLTQSQSWKQINSLEGDECPRCAELAFGGVADLRWSIGQKNADA
jgi:hypothetical protein